MLHGLSLTGSCAVPLGLKLAAYWLKRAYELSGVPKSDGSLWHAFRRLWATERKVKNVAAAGGWKDVTTLIYCQACREPVGERVEGKWSELPGFVADVAGRRRPSGLGPWLRGEARSVP